MRNDFCFVDTTGAGDVIDIECIIERKDLWYVMELWNYGVWWYSLSLYIE